MSNYKILTSWHEEDNVAIKAIDFDDNYQDRLNKGVSLKSMQNPVATLKKLKGNYTDFLFSPSVELIVSERVKTLLEEEEGNENFEFYPVSFSTKSAIPFSYYMLNMIGVTDAFDWEKSDYKLFDQLGPRGNKVIRELYRMEIDPDKTQGRNIFIMENYTGTIFIHEFIISLMEAKGLTGFKALPLRGHNF